MKSIGILNLTRFGDLVQTTPLLLGLRKRYPDADVHLVVKKRFSSIAHMLPGVTRVHELDSAAVVRVLHDPELSFVERFQRVRELLAPLRELHFDKLFNLTHSRSSAVLLSLLNADERVGYALDRDGHRSVRNPWLNHVGTVVRARRLMRFNLVDIYLGAADLIGCGEPLAVHVSSEARRRAEEVLDLDAPRVALQLGASQDQKTWPVSAYAETLRLLSDTLPELRVLLVGVDSERARADELVRSCPDVRFEDHVGATSLPELAAFLERSDLLLTGDTGTMHLAAALGTPIVAVFVGIGNPYETAPYGEGHWIVRSRVPCAPCQLNVVCNHPICHDDIPPAWLAGVLHRRLRDQSIEDVPTLPRAELFKTTRDETGMLHLEPAHVRRPEPEDLMALVYRAVFFESLGGPPIPRTTTWRRARKAYAVEPSAWSEHLPSSVRDGLLHIEQLAERGIQIARSLPQARTADALRMLGRELQTLDAELLAIARAQPLLQPLALAFESGMETLQDGALEHVAQSSADEYRLLRRRAELMRETIQGTKAPTARPDGGGAKP